jgi:small-conductance mechanosensitive channel
MKISAPRRAVLRIALILAALFALMSPATVQAQSLGAQTAAPPVPLPLITTLPAPGPPVSEAALEAQVDQADAALRQVSRSFGAADLTDADIQSRLAALPPIEADIADALAKLTPRMALVDQRLAQLGPAPGPGQPGEAPEIVKSRKSLTALRQNVDSEIKQAKLLQVEAAQIRARLQIRQRQQLAAHLWTHSKSILDIGLWTEFAAAVPGDIDRLKTALSTETLALAKGASSSAVVIGWITALIGALAVAVPLRFLLDHVALQRVSRVSPGTRLRRTLFALAQVLVAVLTPLIALGLIRDALGGVMTPTMEQLAPLVIRVVVFASFFESLGRALLSPGRSSWRLAPIPDELVRRLRPYPGIIAVTAAFAALVRGANTLLGTSQPTTVAADCVTVLIELAAIGAALGMMGLARSEHLAAASEEAEHHEAESRLPWIIAALLAWLTLAAALTAVLAGYVEMASKLIEEMVWIATVLASLFLVLRFIDDLIPAVLSPERPIGRFLRIAIGLSGGALEQIAVLTSGLIRLALLLFGWAAILAPFGAGAGDVAARVTSSQLIVHIGQVTISPGAVLGAIAVFGIGLLITRGIRGWLEKRYLPKTRIDVGLRTSLASGVTYLGGFLAILFTFSYLGLSFDKIALFASALSVGIGFGLQSVIGNFVSGLILLAERPVKVGDWIAIGDLEGDVKRINVRATEIEMFDRSKLIVPNSDLISKVVRNVTPSGAVGRIRIVLKIDDSADPAAVRDLMLARLQGHALVLQDPPPAVYLSNVVDGALEFTAFAYVGSPRNVYKTRSDLLFQIVPDLKAKGIVLANATPVVNVGLGDRVIEPAPEGGPGSNPA